MAQAVRNRLHNAEARVRSQVKSCGICGGKCNHWEGVLRVLRFPLPIFITPSAPNSCIIRGWQINGRHNK
jgi:hypothetical protein